MRLEQVDSDRESVTVRLSAPVTVPFLGPILGGRAEVVARARLDYRSAQ
jgi:hypothetical protein